MSLDRISHSQIERKSQPGDSHQRSRAYLQLSDTLGRLGVMSVSEFTNQTIRLKIQIPLGIPRPPKLGVFCTQVATEPGSWRGCTRAEHLLTAPSREVRPAAGLGEPGTRGLGGGTGRGAPSPTRTVPAA